MTTEINPEKIPYEYALCLNSQCPKAGSCLRHLAAESMTEKQEYWKIVSPKRLEGVEGECPYFRSSQPVRYAKGFKNLLDNQTYNKRQEITYNLTSHFGQRMYYRMRKGERMLLPQEQQIVLNAVKRHGGNASLPFDEYVEDFLW